MNRKIMIRLSMTLGAAYLFFSPIDQGHAQPVNLLPQQSQEKLFNAARQSQLKKKWQDANAKFEQLIRMEPNSALANKARIEIGKYYKYHRDWDTAINKYHEVLSSAPHSRQAQDAVTAEAAIYYFRQDFDRALDLFTQVYDGTEDWDQIKYCSYWIKAVKRKLGIPLEQQFSCGRKSLQIALRHFGIDLNDKEIYNLFDASTTMLSMLELKKAVRKKGLSPQVVKIEPASLEDLDTPFIALVEPQHYVVVNKVRHGEVTYIDPVNESDVVKETVGKFSKEFKGYALVFMRDSRYAKNNFTLPSNEELGQIKGGVCLCCPPNGLGGEANNPNLEFDDTPIQDNCQLGSPSASVNPISMNLVTQATDLSYTSKGMPISLSRVYNSDSPNESIFGKSWTFNYNVKLVENPDESIDVTRGDDKVDHFFWNGAAYQGPNGVHDTLVKNGDGSYSLTLKGSKTSYNFNDTGVLQNITDRNDNTLGFAYTNGTLTQITDPDNQYINLTYGDNGKVSRVTLPDGRHADYTYDGDDNLIQTTNLNNSTVSYSYNDISYMTGINSPGQGSFYVDYYSQNGYHVHSIIDEQGNSRNYTSYNSYQMKVEDSLGNFIMYNTTSSGYTNYISTPLGNKISFAYDGLGNRNQTTDAFGKTTYTTYDGFGNPIHITDPMGKTTNLTWDTTNDTLTSVTDPKGNTYGFTYDSNGNLITLTDPDSEVTQFDYNANGQLLNLTAANGGVTTFTYDAGGNLTRMEDPRGEITNYTYDSIGRLTSLTDPNANTFEYTYDDADHLTNVTYPNSTSSNFTYSCCNLIEAQDPSGTLNFSYSNLGRLATFTNQDNQTLYYEYDSNGNLLNLTYPGNNTINYQYDSDNRLKKVTDWLGHNTTYNYDLAGRLTSSSSPGLVTVYAYDDAGKLTTLINYDSNMTITSAFSYSFDDNSNRNQIASYLPLNNATYSLTNSTYTYNNDNQLTDIDNSTLNYDNNGNLLSISGSPSLNYTYNILNQLTCYSDGTHTYNYTYDALGNRISKQTDSTTTKFIVTPGSLSSTIAETDSYGNPTSYYVYGLGLISKINAQTNSTYYYQYDGLGSTVAITDTNGTIVNSYAYDDFGNVATNSVETIDNPFKYVGRYGVMTDTPDLLYMRARYYKPSIGRFINKDPIGFGGGVNLYNYVGANPINWFDPLGLSPDGIGEGFCRLEDVDVWLQDDSINPLPIWEDPIFWGIVGWGKGPWVGTGGIHPPHHGMGRHFELIIKIGKRFFKIFIPGKNRFMGWTFK